MGFDPQQIMNLVGQLGGDHQQAAQQLQGMDQIDPQQHSGLLEQFGIDPQHLENGGYQQHLDAQQQPAFQGYQPGADYASQQPSFSGQAGGYDQGGGYEQAGEDQAGGFDRDSTQEGY
jgi:hypothetical protein